MITSKDKAELLKPTIYQLYSKEGRSKSYISRLLKINRKTIADKIREWDFPEAEPRHHMKPSTKKFLNRNRTYIESRLNKNVPITEIARSLKVSRDFLQRGVIPYDKVLNKAYEEYISRLHGNAAQRREEVIKASSRNYGYERIDGEIWKPILGFPAYEVSDYGRIRRYSTRNKAHYLLIQAPNKNNGRLYVKLATDEKEKNIQVARLVAHTFVDGYDDEHSTVNHIDGNVANNKASNLQWVSQSENNTHSYRTLDRVKNNKKRYNFTRIVYQDKYEFKTVAAFARFIGKSETQTRRYMDNPKKYGIELVK